MIAANPIEKILRKVTGADAVDLSQEVARFFLSISFSAADEDQIALLSEKANEGDLTPEEYEELNAYVLVHDFLTLMHLRAYEAIDKSSQAT